MKTQEELKEIMLGKKTWAVVGASHHKKNFGYKIYRTLKRFGYEVYPVNPGSETIDGDKAYPTVESIPAKVDCVDMVVKPDIGIKLLEGIKRAGVKYVWLQPGASDEAVLERAVEQGIDAVSEGCVMAELNNRGKL